ncbi:FAD-dependent monooxygenase [Nocardia macrotermitis]|uniref:3-(3-hydroxy-phenyl)propionate/3-hydroxycinnamic acid hydroxylase n=1 Tax=Nocardia macrotermitis TaxID=2585198 RepID=A0A7K0CWA0_9NOCA|nr:FAD-dependent monooxygenase [Nocardia macrotermitis]MQY17663.1 3-(3-hydroxy-phenyl)propionate/3-hydroxycinnamic acid hydroxylase [Nocardia macrotermitis]
MTVLIAGAGPTGLALACGLLRRDVPVRLVDAADGPAVTSRALGVQPRGAEVLDRLDALGDLPERGIRSMSMSMHAGDRDLLRVRVGEAVVRGRYPILLVSQAEVEATLRRRLADLGGTVEWGTAVTDATQCSGGVEVTLDGVAQPVRADWLVGCDGAHSAVRKLANIDFPGVPLIERFLLADVHADLPLDRSGTHLWPHRDGLMAVFPLPGDDLWRFIATTSSEADDALDQLSGLLTSRTGIRAELGEPEWLSTFRIQRRLAEHYRRGRIVLAGDAAHIHSPFGGQGLNTGIGDAENLAWKLVLIERGIAGETLVDTYAAERRPIAAEVLGSTTLTTTILLGSTFATRLLRDRIVLPVMRRPIAQRRLLAAASQLGVSYRGGPLAPANRLDLLRAARRGEMPGIRPGDRVPDLKCVLPDGSTTMLYRQLAGRWVLLGPDHTRPPAFSRLGTEIHTLATDVRERYLIRPDAHLAWRSGRGGISLDASLDLLAVP